MHFARLFADPELRASGHRRICWYRTRGSRFRRRVLWRRLRLKGRRVSVHGDTGAYVAQDRTSGHDACKPCGRAFYRLGAARFSGKNPHGLRSRWSLYGRGSLSRSGKRTDDRLERLPFSGRCDLLSLFGAGDAFSRHSDQYEHAATRTAARSRPKPNRHGHRALARQGRSRARYRSVPDSANQRDDE